MLSVESKSPSQDLAIRIFSLLCAQKEVTQFSVPGYLFTSQGTNIMYSFHRRGEVSNDLQVMCIHLRGTF